jgi:nicotinic acid mononucleotide adenylyltransferase
MLTRWKIERDPFYSTLAAMYEWTDAELDEAGYFEDTATTDLPLSDTEMLCTPLSKVASNMRNLPRDARPVVLLCTGAYNPVHDGHIQMMEDARKAVEEAGYTVVGGYLSPGHDGYINLKLGDYALDVQTRVELCRMATADSEWLDVDPWEGIHRPCAVNFTDVHAHLEAVMAAHIRHDVQVVYVCGGDNARFALTYLLEGMCCVVTRPGNDDSVQKYRNHPRIRHNARIMWAEGGHPASSTAVRAGDYTHVCDEVAAHLRQPTRPLGLILRTEDYDVVRGLGLTRARWLEYQQDLEKLMAEVFEGRVSSVNIASQRRLATTAGYGKSFISLDPMLPATHNLQMSRLYDIGGYRKMGYTERPGSTSFEAQVQNIPPGEYILMDDDIVTGGTVAYAEEILKGRASVVGWYHLETSEGGTRDIADSRDFMLGAKEAGLVMQMPNGVLARAPYIYPFVDPTARSSIPPEHALRFSAEVWDLNYQMYRDTDIVVANLPYPVQVLLHQAGFHGFTRVDLVCRLYRDAVRKNIAESK